MTKDSMPLFPMQLKTRKVHSEYMQRFRTLMPSGHDALEASRSAIQPRRYSAFNPVVFPMRTTAQAE